MLDHENHLYLGASRGFQDINLVRQFVDEYGDNILATNFDPCGWKKPNPWVRGNFNGDRDVDICDFNLIATNFAPLGVEVTSTGEAEPVADPGEVDLIVDIATGEVKIDANNASINGFQITSVAGTLVAQDPFGSPIVLQFLVGTDATFYSEAALVGNMPLNGETSLGALYDLLVGAQDINFTYTQKGVLQPFIGNVIYVPEPASLVLVFAGGLLALRRRSA